MKKIVYRTVYLSVYLISAMLAIAPSAFATGQTPEVVMNAKRLAEDALTWILILVPVTAVLMTGYHAWMKSMADGEPGAIAERNKKMKNVLVSSAIAEGASGIVKVILSYFS